MEKQMLEWIREFGMFETLQAFRRALLQAMSLTSDQSTWNRMCELANWLGQKV